MAMNGINDRKIIIKSRKSGFTLIELSIVLVIIGLLVGGILVGRDLIKAAEIRAQISQFQEFQIAANTFKAKYGYLPGDIPNPDATQLGFDAGGSAGNGDGVIYGCCTWNNYGDHNIGSGEPNWFIVQLGLSGLIKGKFSFLGSSSSATGSAVASYLPKAKLGGESSYFYAWSGGPVINHPGSSDRGNNRINYLSFGSNVTVAGTDLGNQTRTTAPISPIEAFAMDSKMDDGMPQSGIIQAFFYGKSSVNPGNNGGWWAGGEYADTGRHTPNSPLGTTLANPRGATNCYDNNNVVGPQQYSISAGYGDNITCAVSLQF